MCVSAALDHVQFVFYSAHNEVLARKVSICCIALVCDLLLSLSASFSESADALGLWEQFRAFPLHEFIHRSAQSRDHARASGSRWLANARVIDHIIGASYHIGVAKILFQPFRVSN